MPLDPNTQLPAPWKDITVYNRDDLVRTPTNWELVQGDLRIELNRHAILIDEVWVPVWLVVCPRLGLNKPLMAPVLADAALEATATVVVSATQQAQDATDMNAAAVAASQNP